MAVEAALSAFRGESITISWTSTDEGLDITGRPMTFRLLDAPNGTTLGTLTPGSGITISGEAAMTIVVPSATLDVAPGEYYYSVSDTTLPALYTHGPFAVYPPRANADPE